MEIKHMRTFLTLCDTKNFTKAARTLHYAQSYVTTQIQQLEEELGVRLFERIGKRTVLTAEGENLIPYAQDMLRVANEAKQRFADRDAGRLVLGASESICIYRLPSLLTSFQNSHPKVELGLKAIDSHDFLPYLDSGAIDLALVLGDPVQAIALRAPARIDEPIYALAAPGHPLANREELSIEDFADIPLLLTAKECCYRRRFEKELQAAGIAPRVALETGSIQAIKQIAISGIGVCILPLMAVQEELERSTLVRLPYPMDYGIVSQLVHHKDKRISMPMRNFISLWEGMRSPL